MAIAGLEEIFSDFNFEGDKESIANGAVLRLHKYGWCRDPADAHALGLLIEYICGLPAVNEPEKKPLREIEKKHSLFPRP